MRLRGNPLVPARLAQHPPSDIAVCAVVLAELRYGAASSGHAANEQAKVDAFVAPYVSLPFDAVAAGVFGEVRHALMSAGKPIGLYDTMIAAVALANNLTLVTHNTSEFGRIPGPTLEDWELP